jgi:hypothetical protein
MEMYVERGGEKWRMRNWTGYHLGCHSLISFCVRFLRISWELNLFGCNTTEEAGSNKRQWWLSNYHNASIKNGNSSYEGRTDGFSVVELRTNARQYCNARYLTQLVPSIFWYKKKIPQLAPRHVVTFHWEKTAGKDTSFRLLRVTELLLQRKIPGSDIPTRLNLRTETRAWALAVSDDRYSVLKIGMHTASINVAVKLTKCICREKQRINR